jgi:2-polyprenyl-3-methyl-5-hydroxy-6-metoxy-1,4-benzoquinol methylase
MSRHCDSSRTAVCPLCGGTAARHLVTKRGHEVVRCAACTLVFVWPQPTAEELDALYSGGSYHAAVDEAERHRHFARRLRQIEHLAPRRGRILDVGCSKGFLLDVARAEGWDAVGIELNRNAVEEARARGLDVRQGEFDDRAFDEASFDVVTLFDLLEHARDPRGALAACRRVLRPGGLLVVTTPDIGGLVPRVTYGLFAGTLGAWDHPTPPGHLIQFSRRTLRQLLENTGFEIVSERSEHIPVAYSVGKLENSILDALTGRHKVKPRSPEGWKKPGPGAGGGEGGGSPLRRGVRLGVRGVCWVVIGLAGLLARAAGRGDSMRVVARRPASQTPSAG